MYELFKHLKINVVAMSA